MPKMLRVPFVLTCSAVAAVAAVACGSEVTVKGEGTPNPNCPETAPTTYEECALGPGETCLYELDCQSGPTSIQFTCHEDGYGWRTVQGQACRESHDSCPGTELYCAEQWGMPYGTNPPAPCPVTPPVPGSECSVLAMGAVRSMCGYRCDGDRDGAWQVATCSGSSGPLEKGSWAYDDSCD